MKQIVEALEEELEYVEASFERIKNIMQYQIDYFKDFTAKEDKKILANFQMTFNNDEQLKNFLKNPNHYDLNLLKIKTFEI